MTSPERKESNIALYQICDFCKTTISVSGSTLQATKLRLAQEMLLHIQQDCPNASLRRKESVGKIHRGSDPSIV